MAVATQNHEIIEGDLIPSFSLSGVNVSGQVSPWDYKQHKNLVLIFLDLACTVCHELLQQLDQNYNDYRELNAEVLVIASGDVKKLRQLQQDLSLPFPLLSDADGEVFSLYRGQSANRHSSFGVFITDRWGALFTKTVASDPEQLPTDSEIRDWLSFIEIQCPECYPPERVR